MAPLATQPNLQKLPYTVDSFDDVCLVYANPQAVIVRADQPFKDANDLLAYAKANLGKLNYGSAGPGGMPAAISRAA